MKSTLLRTGSTPVHNLTRSTSGSNLPADSPRISFHCNNTNGFSKIRRSISDTGMAWPERNILWAGSVLLAEMGVIVEEELMDESSISFGNGNGNGQGKGNHNRGNRGNDNGNRNDKDNLKEYYVEMLKCNPNDPLLLRNYGKYLHEVEKDGRKAEEYYERAILATPNRDDGDLLSLYATLIWETHRDQLRAQFYFDQSIHASPNDSTVLASYARFLWEIEDEEGEVSEIKQKSNVISLDKTCWFSV